MAHTSLSHRRTHNLLLISKLLSQRDAASPFTLVLDSLEQTAKPLMKEYLRRASLVKTYVIFLAFETVKAPTGTDHFVPCWNKTPAEIAEAVARAVNQSGSKRHHILFIDSLHPLCTLSLQHPSNNSSSHDAFNLTQLLSALIAPPQASTQTQPSQDQTTTPSASPTTSLVAVYHTDIPLPHPSNPRVQSYQPTPLSLLTYLATTILTTHPLASLLAANAAHARSLAPPTFGLEAAKEGIVIGLKPAKFTRHLPHEQRGVVLELEHRRKSGRGVREWYFLPANGSRTTAGAGGRENVTLLDDHPLFRSQKGPGEDGAEELTGLTFELGLTDRQRMERDGVVLPYFDAQRDGGMVGPGEGGRILYDMGAEDDFDEEEDEI